MSDANDPRGRKPRAPEDLKAMKLLGAELRRQRIALGKELRVIADFAEVSPSHLKAIEAGKTLPSIVVTVRLVDALGMDLRDVGRFFRR